MVDIPEDEEDILDDSAEEADESESSVEEVEQRTLREVLAEQDFENRRLRRAEHLRLQAEQDERVKQLAKRRKDEATAERVRRVRASNDSRQKVCVELNSASRALRNATRVAAAASVPRFTLEGMEQRRMLRAIDEAAVALRRALRLASQDAGSFDEPESAEPDESPVPVLTETA